MLKSKRQTEIIDILKAENFATVTDLSKRLYASNPTIRRDLTLLESEGYVKRCHGGAMLTESNSKPPIYFRREQNATAKVNICRAAASLIHDRDVIFIDASSTAFHITDYIKKDSDITVITNGLSISSKLSETGFLTYSLGGRLLKESLAFVGKTAEDAIDSYNADIMFFSVASVSENGILSDWSEYEASLRIKMAKRSRCKVLLCDSSKFNKSSAFTLFPLDELSYIVTDAPLSHELIKTYKLKLIKSEFAYMYSVRQDKNTRTV